MIRRWGRRKKRIRKWKGVGTVPPALKNGKKNKCTVL